MNDNKHFMSFMQKPKHTKKEKSDKGKNENSDQLTVSELTNAIKDIFKDNFAGNIKVKGEVYNCKVTASGHVYLSLRDSKSEIRSIIWKSTYEKFDNELKDGDNIVATGKIDIYEKAGSYQFYINQIDVDGVGDIYENYIKLKEKLTAEGYFDKSHKKQMPESIKRVGIVTSSAGAVMHDMLTVLEKNDYAGSVEIKDSVVQGDKCPESVCIGIDYFNTKEPFVDVIIIARGGGSFQDLMGFSDESVVKAIYESKIFTISAVGHETDSMLSDYTADLRAGTPSIAAEMIIKNQTKLSDKMDVICDLTQCRDMILAKIAQYKNKHDQLVKLLIPPIILLEYQQQKLHKTLEDITKIVREKIDEHKNKLYNMKLKLETMSPDHIIKNGFVMVYDSKTNKQIKSVKDIQKYGVKKLRIKFIDGPIEVNLT